MNLVGKIFVVLIFFMSVAFMSFAVMVYATHKNWRDEIVDPANGWKAKLAAADKKTADLQAEKDAREGELTAERTAALQALMKSENALQGVSKENDELSAQVADLTKAQTAASVAMSMAQKKYDTLRKDVDVLRADIKLAQTSESSQFSKATALADKLHVAMGQLATLTDRNQQLSLEVVRQREALKAGGQMATASGAAPAAPAGLAGIVLAVGASDLVEVSIGSDDGLQAGHTLDVYRGNKYLGRVRVLKTDPDRAVGSILKDYSQGIIQKGDNVVSSRQT